MVCEFVGLPGAGKTTVAAAVVEHFRTRGWSCGERRGPRLGARGRALLAAQKSGFHVLHPSYFIGALQFCCSVRPVSLATISRAGRLANHRYALGRAREARLDPIVLDQGLVQELWSIVLTASTWSEAKAEQIVRRTLRSVNAVPTFIYFDVPADQAAQRVQERPSSSSRFDHLGIADSRRALAEGAPVLDQLFELVLTVTGAASCRVDATRPLQDVASDAIAFISASLGAEPLGAALAAPLLKC